MSIILVKEPQPKSASSIYELPTGTWFIDPDDNIYALVLDDRTNERRAVSLSAHCQPFVPRASLSSLKVKRVLLPGTVFQISYLHEKEMTENDA